ncbi:hypothetical protein ACFFX1_35660 [Dactylosporangium sucinum]|uniref:Uncharacterized protein n=1 Tax=Dactylosporangium sucinum TaxID=1424081 RepID=A0A917UC78_9ACTN|nr:hypothetical protein [Dactylosporangium sucinum]GGM78804.1 hypothetical protein GCM10007977_095500 [Dactylosporangium sucinum]
MNLGDVEREMARLDRLYRPVATAPVDVSNPDAMLTACTAIDRELAEINADGRAESLLRAAVAAYAEGDDLVRAAVRGLFDRYEWFRWGAHFAPDWTTAEELRARLIHFSARDQGADTRDELLGLRDLLTRARRLGIDPAPVLAEVAAMSSDADRYGMGSTRDLLLRHC